MTHCRRRSRYTSDMSEGTFPQRVEGLEIEPAGDGFIVYDEARERVHYLNHTAALVLELSAGELDVPGMASWIAQVYSLPEPPIDDVQSALSELVTERLVTATGFEKPADESELGSAKILENAECRQSN